MIKFNFHKPDISIRRVKATVQKDGKLGFSSGAAKAMELESKRYYRIATNADDVDDDNLYMVEASKDSEDVFRVAKAGAYFYVRVKQLMEQLKVNYQKERVMYDITQVVDNDNIVEYFKLERREPIRRG